MYFYEGAPRINSSLNGSQLRSFEGLIVYSSNRDPHSLRQNDGGQLTMTISKDINKCFGFKAEVELHGQSQLRSRFDIPQLAEASLGAVGLATAELMQAAGLSQSLLPVQVDRRLALRWFAFTLKPEGWAPPPSWDELSGDYQTQDGWIKLHTNAEKHKRAAVDLLKTPPTRADFADAIRSWKGETLESRLHDAGGVGAVLRSRQEWTNHPNGRCVRREPIVAWSGKSQWKSSNWEPSIERPLNGLRVLDLTRILAGPTSTRTLAGLGARVLRVDPPGWEEQNVEHEITLGKNCSRLELTRESDRARFKHLLSEADILVHGLRPAALDGLGFGADWRSNFAPHLLEVTINAYGWTGPWTERRGYDSLVQMSSGLSHESMEWSQSDHPVSQPLPALDYGAGYLMAAAAIKLMTLSLNGQNTRMAKLSLSRVAELLIGQEQEEVPFESDLECVDEDFNPQAEMTSWGAAHRLRSPLHIRNCELAWNKPACRLGSNEPQWPSN